MPFEDDARFVAEEVEKRRGGWRHRLVSLNQRADVADRRIELALDFEVLGEVGQGARTALSQVVAE